MSDARVLRCVLLLAAGACASVAAQAANVCIDAQGKKYYTDKQCPSVEPAPPPPPPPPPLSCKLSADQLQRATRLENQFVTRYPNEGRHRDAEASALKPVTERIQVTQTRRAELLAQRKPLEKELEFYEGRPVPAWLKNKIDANDAHLAAVDEILKNREQESVDIKARYKCERDTFGMMWRGAARGQSACDRPACAQP